MGKGKDQEKSLTLRDILKEKDITTVSLGSHRGELRAKVP